MTEKTYSLEEIKEAFKSVCRVTYSGELKYWNPEAIYAEDYHPSDFIDANESLFPDLVHDAVVKFLTKSQSHD